MSKQIVAFGASNSQHSINKQLATYTAHEVPNGTVVILDLNDYEMPIYSIDREKTTGIPQLAHDFKSQLRAADGIIISFFEHNGAYATAFKNIFDWISRIEKDVWYHKPMFLLATSPGARGGQTVLEIAHNKFKFINTNTITTFSLPAFSRNFSPESGIVDEALRTAFQEQLAQFVASL